MIHTPDLETRPQSPSHVGGGTSSGVGGSGGSSGNADKGNGGDAPKSVAPANRSKGVRASKGRTPIVLLFVYLGLPLVALLLFSFSRYWNGTVLPTAFTLQHWGTVFENQDVVAATGRSLFVTAMVCVINWIIVIPAAYIGVVVAPKLRALFHGLAIAPFALPWIVIAAGMQLTVGELAPQLFATVGLLIVTICAVTFPYLYWAVESALITNNVKQLSEAAQLSGAGWFQTMTQVVVPAARKGIMSGTLLVASSAFGEFAITQIIIGGAYETLPLWTLRMFQGRTPGAGTELAAVSFAIFLVLLAISLILTRIDSDPSQPTLGGSQKLKAKKGVKR